MLPPALEELSEKMRMFPGIGKRSSQKLAIDVLQLSESQFAELIEGLQSVRHKIKFCENCGFFSEGPLCEICQNPKRKNRQICLVEQPTDVITVEKSSSYFGHYHVLKKLISPLDNIFPENTTLNDLFTRRLPKLIEKDPESSIELILFFKAGFASEATTAYIREKIAELKMINVKLTRLAQGLPLYYNPDTLDQATMAKALEDRREV